MANNVAAFQSEVWSKQLVKNLDQINVMKALVNRDWEGDLRKNRTVNVRTLGNISLSDYTKYNAISYQDLNPGKEQFQVNVNKYFGFNIDDIDEAQTDLSILEGYTRRAAPAIDNEVDRVILKSYSLAPGGNQITASGTGSGAVAGTVTLTNGAVTAIAVSAGGTGYDVPPIVAISHGAAGGGGFGARAHAVLTSGAVTSIVVDNGGVAYNTAPTVAITPGDPITLDSSTTQSGSTEGVFPVISRLATALSQANVPEKGRWLVVDPPVRQLLWNDTAHFVRATELGDRIVTTGQFDQDGNGTKASDANGFIGEIAGFETYMVTHLPTGAAAGSRYLVAGNRDAITYAAQIVEMEAIRLQSFFGTAIRGLLVHDSTSFNENCNRLGTAYVI